MGARTGSVEGVLDEVPKTPAAAACEMLCERGRHFIDVQSRIRSVFRDAALENLATFGFAGKRNLDLLIKAAEDPRIDTIRMERFGDNEYQAVAPWHTVHLNQRFLSDFPVDFIDFRRHVIAERS